MTDSLNPTIRELQVGIRKLRTIKIYPLSMHCQFELTEIIVEAISKFTQGEENAAVKELISLIQTNLRKILEFVTDEKPDELFKDMTNGQGVELAKIIYEVNYENELKNVQDLIKTIRQSKLMRSLPQSFPPQAIK